MKPMAMRASHLNEDVSRASSEYSNGHFLPHTIPRYIQSIHLEKTIDGLAPLADEFGAEGPGPWQVSFLEHTVG